MPTYSEAIKAYAEKQDAFNTRYDTAVEDLAGDIKFFKDEIARLQNSPGAVTPEDQATIDRLQARAEAATLKIEAMAAEHPPVVPPPPPA